MFFYLLRRLLYAVPILIGVNLFTFLLFFWVNTPDDMARLQLGVKYVTQNAIDEWKKERGYDHPLFLNAEKKGVEKITQTVFFQKSVPMFWGDLGFSESGTPIVYEIKKRALPSFLLALPTFLLGFWAAIISALFLVYVKHSLLDFYGVMACVVLMSISSLFYIIGGQFLFARVFQWVPISGFGEGLDAWRFVILPVFIGTLAGLGGTTRWYRTLFLEESTKDYVFTARAKGLKERVIFFKHILKNALIPILTGVVVLIPSLFLGSLLMESFFGIPGLGSYTIDAIHAQDFSVVRAMVFVGSVLYILGLILTDLSYTLADPRIRLTAQ